METHVRDVSIKLQKRVINLHIIPYLMGRCVIWIDIHQSIWYTKIRFACNQCDTELRTAAQVERHKVSKHEDTCDLCGKCFSIFM